MFSSYYVHVFLICSTIKQGMWNERGIMFARNQSRYSILVEGLYGSGFTVLVSTELQFTILPFCLTSLLIFRNHYRYRGSVVVLISDQINEWQSIKG